MPQVKWLPEALLDIQRLYDFLAETNPTAATHAIERIRDSARQLESFPEIGRTLHDGTERKEIYSAFGSGCYVIRYRIDAAGDPVVIRVWHSRERR